MPVLLTDRSATASGIHFTRAVRRDLILFPLLVLLGSLAVVRPLWMLVALAASIVLGFCWWVIRRLRPYRLERWQILVIVAVTGYRLLNYGFENLTIHVGGLPLIVGYGLMYAALILAIFTHWQAIRQALKEPAVLSLLALIGFSFLHLVVDLPSYGLWAVRDSSLCLDGVFLLLGVIWGMRKNSATFLTKWFLLVFAINMVYSFTLPWGEKLWSWSPESGVFLPVAILGNYNGVGDLLAAGALFCICIDARTVKCPRWLMLSLAGAQLLGIAIAQTRRTYLGLVVVLIILLVLRETKPAGKLILMLTSGILLLFLLTTVAGLQISGRIGPVNIGFFGDHIRSISGAEDTPGSDIQSRFEMSEQAMAHFHAHPILGEGFGQPLTSIIDMTNGAVTRMPHNSSLSILARLGVIGFAIWIAFHLCLISRFIYAFRRKKYADRRVYDVVLWLCLFYVNFVIASLVEASFEFPSSAVPFYFSMGFALGLVRWRLFDSNKSQRGLEGTHGLRGRGDYDARGAADSRVGACHA
jgi:O-antigen ligase